MKKGFWVKVNHGYGKVENREKIEKKTVKKEKEGEWEFRRVSFNSESWCFQPNKDANYYDQLNKDVKLGGSYVVVFHWRIHVYQFKILAVYLRVMS